MALVNAFGDIALDTSVQSVVTEIGALADASVTAGATGSVSAKLRRISADLATLLTQTDGIEASLTSIDTGTAAALGSAASAASAPVVIASDQAAVAVKLADGVDVNQGAIADAAVSAGATGSVSAKLRRLSADIGTLLTQTDGIEASLTSIDGGTPAALGSAASSASMPVVIASDQAPPALTLTLGERAGATSATQFASVAAKWVKVKAQYDNAGRVYIGGSSVTKADGSTDTTTGWQLVAGDETPWLPISNLNALYLICDNTGDDTTYMVLA